MFEATILIADVKGFAGPFATMSERDGAAWLNSLLYRLTEPVLRHDGMPVRYAGDTLFAFFSGTEHRDHALRAALLTHQIMEGSVIIGLHTGPIYFGRIGHPDYAQRDISGPCMVVAVRVQEWAANQRSGIVATAAVVDGLSDSTLVASVGERHSVQLRSVQDSTQVCEISVPAPLQ